MKQNYKKLIFPALAVAILLPLVSMASSDDTSFSERGKKFFQSRKEFVENFDRSQMNKEEMFLQREDRRLENRAKHTEMMEVLEAGDYSAWLEFVKDKNCPMTAKINEENFSEFVEKHKLRMENREDGFANREIDRQNNFRFRK